VNQQQLELLDRTIARRGAGPGGAGRRRFMNMPPRIKPTAGRSRPMTLADHLRVVIEPAPARADRIAEGQILRVVEQIRGRPVRRLQLLQSA